jgi:UDPglucose 6-dehydrogenase
MIDMRVGVVGGGVVGAATARALVEHVKEVRVYDLVPERGTHRLHETVMDSDVVFVCLPTPQKAGSLECDTSIVEEFFSHMGGLLHTRNFVLRSTVPPGFTKRMRDKFGLENLVHSPEFLTARCADLNAHMPGRNIVGYPDFVPVVENASGRHPVEDLYNARWPHVPLVRLMSWQTELVKLATNGFFAVKVVYWNEVYQFCRKLRGGDPGAAWTEVIETILLDGRIHESHTKVPGPDGKFGFGGACLPKDLANLISSAMEAGAGAHVCMAAYDRNAHIDRVRGG